jgi:type IV fimbrial biogenesis protein FimT
MSGLRRGLTIIELMVALAVLGVLVTLAAPAMSDMILVQRVRSINADLVTDLQFARSEAVSRNLNVTVMFGSTSSLTCYTIVAGNSSVCDCTRGAGSVCTAGTASREIRTVSIPRSSGVTVLKALVDLPDSFEYDARTGGIFGVGIDSGLPEPITYIAQTKANKTNRGVLETAVNPAGRPTVCSRDVANPSVKSC